MRILLATQSLMGNSREETWVIDLASGLSKLGHMVSIFTLNQGNLASKIENYRVFSEYTFDEYEFVIAHGRTAQRLFTNYLKPCRIGLSFFSQEDHFPGLDMYTYHREDKQIPGSAAYLVREAIDTVVFNSEPTSAIKTVLFPYPSQFQVVISDNVKIDSEKPARDFFNMLKEATKKAGMRLLTKEDERSDLKKLIDQSDIVVGTGKVVKQALSCNRQVVSVYPRLVNDSAMGFGLITKENYDEGKRSDFDGGVDVRYFDIDSLAQELSSATTDSLRELIVKDYDNVSIAQEYIKLYEKWKQSTPQRQHRTITKDDTVDIIVGNA